MELQGLTVVTAVRMPFEFENTLNKTDQHLLVPTTVIAKRLTSEAFPTEETCNH
jgi:hypothetical protein